MKKGNGKGFRDESPVEGEAILNYKRKYQKKYMKNYSEYQPNYQQSIERNPKQKLNPRKVLQKAFDSFLSRWPTLRCEGINSLSVSVFLMSEMALHCEMRVGVMEGTTQLKLTM